MKRHQVNSKSQTYEKAFIKMTRSNKNGVNFLVGLHNSHLENEPVRQLRNWPDRPPICPGIKHFSPLRQSQIEM